VPDLTSIFTRLVSLGPLNEAEAESAFEHILSGAADPAQIGAALALMAARTPAVDELVAGARTLRRHAMPVASPADGPFAHAKLIDTCGTGGAPKLFNVSTVAALIIPAAAPGRAMVAKHGNISRTGRGSAELMSALGVNIHAPAAVQTRCLSECGMCFSLAPAHHPAARHAAAARKALGFPTIFNLLGPLANPAGAECQIIGTWTRENARLMAEALARLGGGRAWVYCSRDGLDELTVSDITHVYEVIDGTVRAFDFDPASVGVKHAPVCELGVGSLVAAADLATNILDGRPGPCRDMALLSAAAALVVAGVAADMAEGLAAAARAVDSGGARRTLAALVELSNTA
jgi:anthranilate phosphoribosyltransferase